MINDYILSGTTMAGNHQIITKGKIITRDTSLWEFDKKLDKFIITDISGDCA